MAQHMANDLEQMAKAHDLDQMVEHLAQHMANRRLNTCSHSCAHQPGMHLGARRSLTDGIVHYSLCPVYPSFQAFKLSTLFGCAVENLFLIYAKVGI